MLRRQGDCERKKIREGGLNHISLAPWLFRHEIQRRTAWKSHISRHCHLSLSVAQLPNFWLGGSA
jgi:hypothetical protein